MIIFWILIFFVRISASAFSLMERETGARMPQNRIQVPTVPMDNRRSRALIAMAILVFVLCATISGIILLSIQSRSQDAAILSVVTIPPEIALIGKTVRAICASGAFDE